MLPCQVAKLGDDGLYITSNRDSTSRATGSISKSRQKTVYNKLKTDNEEKGFSGNNGFYMAVVKENKAGEETMTLSINTERMLATPPWVVDSNYSPNTMAAMVAAADLVV